MRQIPYGHHLIDDEDIGAVIEVLGGDWLTQGPAVRELEEEIAKRCGARHAVACSSGTAALHLAMLASGAGPGDEIVAPAITFLATANVGLYVGATPRFTDIEFPSVLMTPELLLPALSDKTRAVLPVHFAGLVCSMPEIAELVRSRCPRACILEDASHALGGRHADGTPIGSGTWADMVILSLHPVKHVAAGEGGLVLTDREDLAEHMRRLRSHGTTRDPARLEEAHEGPWYYEMQELGFNFRIPDINCALARSQLRKLDAFLERRREIAARYHEELEGLPHLSLPEPADVEESAWHIYGVHIDFLALGKSRKRVAEELSERGIGIQVHYYPVPLQPYYRHRFGHRPGDFPAAERHYAQALTIPLFPAMTDRDVGKVIGALSEVLR